MNLVSAGFQAGAKAYSEIIFFEDKRALDEFVVDGIETTLPLFRALVREAEIIDGAYNIHWLEEFLARGAIGA